MTRLLHRICRIALRRLAALVVAISAANVHAMPAIEGMVEGMDGVATTVALEPRGCHRISLREWCIEKL